jgi:two-component system nitrate/nitrite sensor histidine kinase NarX
MLKFRHRLSTKIVGILFFYFLVALGAIGMTLVVSRQLEGGAAAINDAGSQRMRTYRLSFLISQNPASEQERQALEQDVQRELALFETVLRELEQGNPARPLFLPRRGDIRERMADLHLRWETQVRPLVLEVVGTRDHRRQEALMMAYKSTIEQFVAGINDLVVLVERNNSRNTALLRSLQVGLVVLAAVGTVIIILFFLAMVIRPLRSLREGMGRMAAADFGVRLPVETRDEFGEVAQGFNQMAGELESLYNTLEQRVQDKTHTLAEQNQELAMLYEIAAFLNEPASVEELCRGFLKRVMPMLRADGGAIRLVDNQSHALHLVAHDGMSEAFVSGEAALPMGECLCGDAAVQAQPASWDFGQAAARPLRYSCKAEGYQLVTVFTIRFKKQLIGVFNLFYRVPRGVGERETRLLETLGQHLGLAVENQRLVSREKEMAVSEERNLLAQELHDSIAQSLAFLNIQAQMLDDSLRRQDAGEAREGLARMREGIQESYDHVRELLVHFRTRLLQEDLESSIRTALEKFEGQTGIAVAFQSEGTSAPLAPDIELQAMHIVQEALSNVRKHARASRVTIGLQRGPEGVSVAVKDDGVGFDPAAKEGAEDHMGLRIMKERAHRIGGHLEIHSAGGQGAEVRLILPRQQKEAA